MTAYVLAVLHEVVYIAPVSAVIAAPVLAALQQLRHRTSPCRDRSICASGGILCASSCSDRSTCVTDRVQHTSSCRNCSTCVGAPAAIATRAPVVEFRTPAPANAYIAPAPVVVVAPTPVDEYIPPAPVVSCAAAALVGYAAPVAVPTAFVVLALAVCAALASVAKYGVHLAMPAVSRAPSSVAECFAPVPALSLAAISALGAASAPAAECISHCLPCPWHQHHLWTRCQSQCWFTLSHCRPCLRRWFSRVRSARTSGGAHLAIR